jgi:hypothetical protein
MRFALAVTNTATLLNLAVRCVLAALLTELLELKTLGRGLAVLGCGVVTILALSALQLTNFAGHV